MSVATSESPIETVSAPRNEPHLGGGRLVTIDALRGVAALSVLFSHLPFSVAARPAVGSVTEATAQSVFPRWVEAICDHGACGVHLFLIISGFCIHMAWARRADPAATVDFGQFWRRRLHRLYPPYVGALLLSIAGLYVLHGVVGGARGSIAARLGYVSGQQLALDLVLLLLLFQNVTGAPRRIGNGPFWSLALEEQLYAFYFPLLWMRKRWNWPRTLVLVSAVTLAWRLLTAFVFPEVATMVDIGPSRWFEWVLGAIAVEAHLGRIELPAACSSGKVGLALAAIAVGVLNAQYVGVPRLWLLPISDPACGAAIFVLVNYACKVRWADVGAGPVGRFFLWVGKFSYSLYLTHQLVIVAAKQVAMRAGVGTVGIVVARIALPILAGWVFYVLVERRFLNSSRRRAQGV